MSTPEKKYNNFSELTQRSGHRLATHSNTHTPPLVAQTRPDVLHSLQSMCSVGKGRRRRWCERGAKLCTEVASRNADIIHTIFYTLMAAERREDIPPLTPSKRG